MTDNIKFLENKDCCNSKKENIKLKQELLSVIHERNLLLEENKKIKKELESIKNDCVDKTYESGLFLEEEVLKNIETENCRLKQLVEEVYTNVSNVWFDMVKEEIRKRNV